MGDYKTLLACLILLAIFISCGNNDDSKPKVLDHYDSLKIQDSIDNKENDKIVSNFRNKHNDCLVDSLEFKFTYQYQDFLKANSCMIILGRILDLKQNDKDYTVMLENDKKIFILNTSFKNADIFRYTLINNPYRQIVGVTNINSVEKTLLSLSTIGGDGDNSYMFIEIETDENTLILKGELIDFMPLK